MLDEEAEKKKNCMGPSVIINSNHTCKGGISILIILF